jgi:hypothetical protein
VLEVSEEQDELVRAAEELGIELAPGGSRAVPETPTVQDTEEGNDQVDPDGVFKVAADEQTIDLDAELAGVDATATEEEDPFGDIGDVDIKDLADDDEE